MKNNLLPSLILVLTLFVSLKISAQTPQDDVLYLKNGSYLRGKILNIDPGNSIKMTLQNSDTLVIKMAKVKFIGKENVNEPIVGKYENGAKSWGYTCIPELGYGVGLLEGLDRYKDTAKGQSYFMLTVFNGFTLSPYIQLGITLGVEIWNTRIFSPVYMDFRSNILKTANSPFVYLDLGYSLGWMHGQAGGGLGGGTAGLGAGGKIMLTRKQALVLSAGYNLQQTREWITDHNVVSKAVRDAHFFVLKAGILF